MGYILVLLVIRILGQKGKHLRMTPTLQWLASPSVHIVIFHFMSTSTVEAFVLIVVTAPLVRHSPASQVKWSSTICTLAMWVTRAGFNQKLDKSKVSFFATVVQQSVATLITIKLGLVYSRLGVTAPRITSLATLKSPALQASRSSSAISLAIM